jgi:hypothetical protein
MATKTTLHVGQTLRSLTDSTWPTITIHKIVEQPDASFRGRRLSPYAYVEWADNLGVYTAMNLANLQTAWEDIGV